MGASNSCVYTSSARELVKRERKKAGGAKPFFEKIHGRPPVGNESITFNNKVNRGSYTAAFLGLIISKLELGNTSLNDLYGNKDRK